MIILFLYMLPNIVYLYISNLIKKKNLNMVSSNKFMLKKSFELFIILYLIITKLLKKRND